MSKLFKKVLQNPRKNISTVEDKPNDFSYKLEVPEFKIPTVINPEYSILSGLELRKAKDAYKAAYDEYVANNKMEKGLGDHDPDLGGVRDPSVLYDHYAREYAKNKTGYDFGDPILDQGKDNEKNKLTTGAIALSFPVISGISAGALGTLPKLGLDLSFAYDGAKTLLSPEGIAKTARFVRQGKLGRAAFSGAGDLLDIGLTRLGLKSLGSIGRYAREVSNVAKFNRGNKAAGFRMDYPWQNTTGNPISEFPTVFNPYNSGLMISAISRSRNSLKAITNGRTYQAPGMLYTMKAKGIQTPLNMVNRYYHDNAGDIDAIVNDFRNGRNDAVNYMSSELKKSVDQHNYELARRKFGYEILPELHPEKAGVPMIRHPNEYESDSRFTGIGQPNNGFYLSVGGLSGNSAEVGIVTDYPQYDRMAIEYNRDISDKSFHEHLHRGDLGRRPHRSVYTDKQKGVSDNTKNFYNGKTEHLLKPSISDDIDLYLRDEGEAPVNMMEIGRRAGISPGEIYPGKVVAQQRFKDIIENDESLGEYLNRTRGESKPKRVWSALNGTYYGMFPLIGLPLLHKTNE